MKWNTAKKDIKCNSFVKHNFKVLEYIVEQDTIVQLKKYILNYKNIIIYES